MIGIRCFVWMTVFVLCVGKSAIVSAQGQSFDIDDLKLDEEAVGSLPKIERNTDFTSRQVGNKKRLRLESGYFEDQDPVNRPILTYDDFESEYSGIRLRLRRKLK